MVRRSLSQSGLTFFGLTPDTAPQYRKNLFTQIHEIVFHGKGGYDWPTVYHMPIWLRKFTFHRINEFYKDEASAAEGTVDNSNKLVDSQGNVNKDAFRKLTNSTPSAPIPKK